MACSDLLKELQDDRNGSMSNETESATLDAVLRAVHDANVDVGALGMRCATALARTARRETAKRLAETLCAWVTAVGKDVERRDASSMCLKMLLSEIGTFERASWEATLEACAPRLGASVERGTREGATSDEINAAAEAVDVLHSLVSTLTQTPHVRLGEEHALALQETLLKHLERGKTGTRKRAAQCLALLSTFMNDELLGETVKTITHVLEARVKSKGKSDLYTFVLGATARAIGFRFGDHAERAMPLLIQVCKNAKDDYDEENIVNIESALQAMEYFIAACPTSVHGDEKSANVIAVALKYLSYDPNFDDKTEDMDTHDDDDEQYSDDGDMYDDDDDDESWKVRRAAAKMLIAVLHSVPETTTTSHFETVIAKLLSRTKDREQSVQLDIFSVLDGIVHVTKKYLAHDPHSKLCAKLQTTTTEIVRVVIRESNSKWPKTQIAAFTLLSSLASVFPGIMAELTDTEVKNSLMVTVERCVEDKTRGSSARIAALTFICTVCASENDDALHPFVHAILPSIFAAVADKYYKVVAHALNACAALVHVLRRDASSTVSKEYTKHIKSLLDAVLTKLDASDEDQEVKDAATHACAVIMAQLNDVVNATDQSRALGLLLERSRNETTRLSAVRAFDMIARSSRPVDLSAVAASITHELTGFLRKANKALRENSLAALEALISSHRASLQDPDVQPTVVEASALINEEDLHLATLAVRLLAKVASSSDAFPNAAREIALTSLPLVLRLTRSPLVQRQTLKSLQELYAAIVTSKIVPYQSLLDDLFKIKGIDEASSQFVSHSLAKCAAAACIAAGQSATHTIMGALLTKLNGASGIEALFTLLCIGEIGRKTNVSANKDLQLIMFSAFDSYGEDIKGASALALGRVAAGNRETYLPLIMSKLKGDKVEHQYSLLQSLREVIRVGNLSEQESKDVLAMLLSHASSSEEGVRNVVAECLGRLASSDPVKLVQDLHNRFNNSANSLEKSTLVSAIKFTVSSSEKGELTKIRDDLRLQDFIIAISDADVNVRSAVIKTINAVTHRESTLIAPLLASTMPKLLEQTAVVPELIRVMDLGAFKHTVDDGLDCRKAAFECIGTILDSCGGLVNARDIIATLPSGLDDHYDVKMLAHAILGKLCDGIAPNSTDAVLSSLDLLCGPLEKTLMTRPKRDAVQQEIDRNEDLLRSALRAVRSIEQQHASADVPSFKNLMANVIATDEIISSLYAKISETATVAGPGVEGTSSA